MNKNKILINLSESDKTKFGKEDFATQSVPQKVFSCIWALESEVNNGGFSQYFQNGDGAETASFVVSALDAIGASHTSGICKRALTCAFPAGLPANPDAISEAATDFTGETLAGLEALDAEFMSYPDNLTELLFAYVAKHPEEFGELQQAA